MRGLVLGALTVPLDRPATAPWASPALVAAIVSPACGLRDGHGPDRSVLLELAGGTVHQLHSLIGGECAAGLHEFADPGHPRPGCRWA